MSRNSIFYKNEPGWSIFRLFRYSVNIIVFACLLILTYTTYQHNQNLFMELFHFGLEMKLNNENGQNFGKTCSYNEVNLDIAMDVANVIYSENRALVLTKTRHGMQEMLLIDLCDGSVINKTKLTLRQEQDSKQHVYNEYTG